MLLLDLPPEIFGRVAMHLVTDVGILKAWEFRKVCRKFLTVLGQRDLRVVCLTQ